VNERGQISIVGWALLALLIAAAVLFGSLGGVDASGASTQRAADMAALAAGRALADDPSAGEPSLRAAAAAAARQNGAGLESLTLVDDHGVPGGVQVEVGRRVEVAGRPETLRARARAAVSFAAQLPSVSFRPVDLHGLAGRAAVVEAAAAQVGWPYVWGGESRAEGGFDCSGLIDYAFAAAGAALPGRPTAADLWHMGQPIAPAELEPGDLVFLGARSGAPYHVGMYVGSGTVLAAPHTGARVGYSPLAYGGWDGFARLLPPDPAFRADDPVGAAARHHGVPANVLAAELRLGLASDADAAAAALARAQAGSDTLEQALAAQLGSESAAAIVLRDGSGPALPVRSSVRLVPTAQEQPAGATAAPLIPAAPIVQSERTPARSGSSWLGHLGTALGASEHAAEQLGERGRAVPLQAAAGIAHLSRFTLTGLSAFLPDPRMRDAFGLAGSIWDAASSSRELVAVAGGAGLDLAGAGLWAARLSAIGGGLSTAMFGWQALTATRRRDQIGYGLMAAGSAATTVGLATAGGSLVALGAGTAVIPPVGLGLIAAGAGLCAAGYLARHPEWCRAAWSAGGRVLDAAWHVETAPVHVAAAAGSKLVDGAKSVIDSIPTPW
jgi:cell wall-associated NlpC family hydrolase